jgi:hypothetical protein
MQLVSNEQICEAEFNITIASDALVSIRDLTNFEDIAIDRGPASRRNQKENYDDYRK